MNYYCKNCHCEIDSPRIRFPVCPVCLNATILVHDPCLVDLELLEQRAEDMLEIPIHETVTAWEKRKGRKYPDTAPVYALDEKGPPWIVPFYFLTDLRTVDKDRRIVLIASEAGKPPDNWKPE